MARTTRDVFHRQGPFVGSGGLYSPGPATAPPLSRTLRPLDDALTSPWVFAGPEPFLYGPARLATRLHAMWSPTFHRRRPLRARPPFTPAGPLLGGLMRELIWDQRRLPTSATAFTTCGHQPELSNPRRDGGRNLLPFLDVPTLPSLRKRCARGEPRNARLMGPRCRFLLLAQVCPTAIPHRARHLRRLAPAECSDDRRARVFGPSEGRVPDSRRRREPFPEGCMRL
jgi:hypothetical protein